MDNKTDKKIDEFTEKLLKDFSRETPSFDFTTKVMSSVEGLSSSTATIYKPLISKRIWFLIAVLALGVFSYLIFGNNQMENYWFSATQSYVESNLKIFNVPDFKVSNVFTYAVTGFAFFMSIQILLLKNHFDRRFA